MKRKNEKGYKRVCLHFCLELEYAIGRQFAGILIPDLFLPMEETPGRKRGVIAFPPHQLSPGKNLPAFSSLKPVLPEARAMDSSG